MNSKQLFLTILGAKLLSEVVETPKSADGKPGTLSVDVARKIKSARRSIFAKIQPYLDAYDAIIEDHNAAIRSEEYQGDDKGDLRNTRVKATNDAINALNAGMGEQAVAILASETEIKFMQGQFDDRDDLITGGDSKQTDRIIAVSDALAAALASEDVELTAAAPKTSANGKPANISELAELAATK
jgi:hypothetical protein